MKPPFSELVPPQDIEAEQATLGAMLIERSGVEKGREILKSSDFYRVAHQNVFEAILTLADRNEGIDLITMRIELMARRQFEEIGGFKYLTSLFETTPTAANVEHYAKIVLDRSKRRQMQEIARSLIRQSLDLEAEAGDSCALTQDRLLQIERDKDAADTERLSGPLDRNKEEAERNAMDGIRLTGIETGFNLIDRKTGGFQSSDLIIVAGRPSMGKTSLVMTLAQSIGERGGGVAVFSLEMSKDQLARRMLCSAAEVDSLHYRIGKLTPEELVRADAAFKHLYELPIFINDRSDMTVTGMRAECRKIQREHGLSAVVVDYIGLVESETKTENQQLKIADICGRLKKLAKEFNVPVLALSQLSRAVEQREDKRPMLSDLRDSGAIEQDADVVIFIYREAYYKRKELGETEPMGGDREEQIYPDKTELNFAKHRNGSTGKVDIGFIPKYAKFVPFGVGCYDELEAAGF